MRKAVVVIPTYNEEGNIKKIVDEVTASTKTLTNWNVEILFVDSNSTDNTGETIKEIQKKNSKVHLLSTQKEGLGKAYLDGFQYALDTLKAYLIFEMDADLSHEPKELPKFIKQIESGSDFVIGSRYIKGGSIPKNWGIHRKIFSTLGNMIIRYGFMNLKISDWTGGFRAIKAWIIKDSMSHTKHYSGYVFQIALLDYAIKKKANISEIPINFKEREYGISKINAFQYITHILMYVFTHSSFVKFVIVGLTGFVVDFGITYFLKHSTALPIWRITLISTESAIIVNYLLNNFWAFSHKRFDNHYMVHVWNFLKFNVVSSGSIAIQTIGIQLLTNMYGEKYLFVFKVLIIAFIIIPYSYILYNKVIWKDKK